MATKEKLNQAIARALHKHNRKRFKAFYSREPLCPTCKGKLEPNIHNDRVCERCKLEVKH